VLGVRRPDDQEPALKRVILIAALLAASPAHSEDNPWARADKPKAGAARSIGGYSAGCVQGAIALPDGDFNFRVTRPERKRVFGHPRLVTFLKELSLKLKKRKLGPLWLGDLGQPRGGPAPSGHASHQTGLDADVYYARDKGETVQMVDLEKKQTTKNFTDRIVTLIKEAASDPRIDRLFVNPVIKRALCEKAGDDRTWLHKIRPWWGHHEHFHVRLPCPDDSKDCKPQDPIADGDGCADLPWWFDDKAQADRKKEQEKYQSKVGALPALPEGCAAVLAD
jgi:penicillin-insensitive murein DD-endopeptidase